MDTIKFTEGKVTEPGKSERRQSSRDTKSLCILMLNAGMCESRDGEQARL